jgi:quercetin dioxygenase-like cupin family protein
MTPEVGTELVNPVAGTRSVFTATSASTGGAYVELEQTYPPDSQRPPKHLHPSQSEHFTVLNGTMHGILDGSQFSITVGDELVVPPGTPHEMWAGDDGAVMTWRTSPALRTGEMFCELWEVARDNDWEPDLMELFEVISKYGDEFCLC